MYQDIKEYIKTCDNCQRYTRQEKNEPLHSIKILHPFERIGIDIIGPLPITSRNNRYIVTATEYFTKWPEAKPLKKADAENVAKFLYEEIICRHGTPKILLSDQGSHFRNELVEKLCQKFKIQRRFSSPYHPQTNGLVERFNKTLCTMLAKLGDITNWDENIPSVLFAYRTTKHNITQNTPFYLIYGRPPVLPIEVEPEKDPNSEIDLEHTFLKRIYEIEELLPEKYNETRKLITKSQQKAQDRHETKIKKKIIYQIGDQVLMHDSRLDKQWSGKLEPKWKGPFKIHKILDKGSYILENKFGIMKLPVHSDRLRPYHDKQKWEPIIVIP
jgi:hypothetical protein